MATKIKWHPKPFNKRLYKDVDKRVGNASKAYARAVSANAPAKTGKLKNSITVVKEGFLKWRVFSTSKYAKFVEYGTSKMGAQPFFRPALKAIKGAFR